MGYQTKIVRLLAGLGILGYFGLVAKLFTLLIESSGWGAVFGWGFLFLLSLVGLIFVLIVLGAIMTAKYPDK